MTMMLKSPERVAKPVVFLLLAAPLIGMVAAGFMGELGANPVEKLTHETGEWALRLLIATLAITPLRKLTRINWLVRLRRMLGLYAFFYVSLHFLTYLWLDQFFDFEAIAEDIFKRPYITLGFTGVLVLIPLAITSTNAMVKTLGGKRWQALHRLAYVAAVLGCLHYLWLVKADYTEPAFYSAVLAVLLLARVPWRRKKGSRGVYSPG